jgi:hypothetical protein
MSFLSKNCHPERSEGSAVGQLRRKSSGASIYGRVALILLLGGVASACTIVEVEVPPKKVGNNVTIVAYKDEKPMVGAPIIIDRLEDGKTQKSALRIAQVLTNASREIALKKLNPGIYALSVLEQEHQHWLGSIEVSTGSHTGISRAEFELIPEAPPPPVAPAPLLLRRIAGELHDPSGAVFANTQVQVRRLGAKGGKPEMETNTNARGEFSLAIPDGSYELRVAVPGFNLARVPLEVAAASKRGWNGLNLTLALARCGPGMNPYIYSVAELTTSN